MQRSFALVAVLSLGIPAIAHPQTPLHWTENGTSATASTAEPPSSSTLPAELRGDLAMARQEYVSAIAAYREAPSGSPEVWDKMGMAWHHLFAFDEARRDYQRALHLRPDYPEALNNLGAVYYAKKDFHKAVKYYNKAIRLNPKAASVYSNLGTAYFALGKTEQGLGAYRTAFTLNPRVFDERSSLMVNESLKPRDRAQQDFCLARIFAASGKNTEAIDYLRKALNEGFDDRKKLLEDQMLASLRTTPEFSRLMDEEQIR